MKYAAQAMRLSGRLSFTSQEKTRGLERRPAVSSRKKLSNTGAGAPVQEERRPAIARDHCCRNEGEVNYGKGLSQRMMGRRD